MNLLEQLSELRNSRIDDPKVTDILVKCANNMSIMDEPRSQDVTIRMFTGGIIIENVDYGLIADFRYSKLVRVYKYENFASEYIEGIESSDITIEKIIHPVAVSLFDKLFEANDYMISEFTSDMLDHYVHIFSTYSFENSNVVVYLCENPIIRALSYGYIVSNNFIALYLFDMDKNSYISNVFVNNMLITDFTYENIRKFMYESKAFYEPITFRQFIGVNNVKSARNF